MRIKYRGTSVFVATLRLIVSVAISSVGLYVSILWLLRDIPDVALINESNIKGIFIDVMVPTILLVLSYGATRDSLLDFFDVVKRKKRDKKV